MHSDPNDKRLRKAKADMKFKEARTARMPFGDYKGKMLDKIAETDEGLKYLDKLLSWPPLKGYIKEALKVYLSDKIIVSEVSKLVRGK